MSVYKKLNEARAKFHALKLSKTGHNKFAGYNYFELGDFLVPALQVFNEVGLCAIVSFSKDVAQMTIIDAEDPMVDLTDEMQVMTNAIVITSPMGSAALKGCHEVQNIGAVETYQRRYLWVAALEIVEHDALDATTGKGSVAVSATNEAFKSLQPEVQDRLRKIVPLLLEAGTGSRMLDVLDSEDLDNDEKAGLWSLLDSKTRAAIKAAQQEQ